MDKFKAGDRVKVVSETCMTYGLTGAVIGRHYDDWTEKYYVSIPGYPSMVFNAKSLKLVSEAKKETNNMAKLTGYKKVAVIAIGSGWQSEYHYALYDDSIEADDKVLVTGRASGQLYTVKKVLTVEEAAEVFKKAITEEVICKVDQSAYEKRVADRAEKEKIRKEMDAMIKKMDETQKYKMYAEMNPDLAALLAKFETLEG